MEYCEGGALSRLTACSKLPGPEPVRTFPGQTYALQVLLKDVDGGEVPSCEGHLSRQELALINRSVPGIVCGKRGSKRSLTGSTRWKDALATYKPLLHRKGSRGQVRI